MKKLGILFLLLALVTLVLTPVAPANATCVQFGKLIAARTTPSGGSYWLSNGGTVSAYYFYTTTSSALMNSLSAAMAAGAWVVIYGNASACGTTGLVRNGGVITQVDTF